VLRPWNRVLVLTGNTTNEWHREDALLAVSIGRRLAAHANVSMVIATRDVKTYEPLVADASYIEVRESSRWRAAALHQVTGTDIVVVPTHAMREAKALGQWRVAKAFADASIIVVGGPHRLSVGGDPVRSALHGVVDSTEASTS
jgi:hypothetical protein